MKWREAGGQVIALAIKHPAYVVKTKIETIIHHFTSAPHQRVSNKMPRSSPSPTPRNQHAYTIAKRTNCQKTLGLKSGHRSRGISCISKHNSIIDDRLQNMQLTLQSTDQKRPIIANPQLRYALPATRNLSSAASKPVPHPHHVIDRRRSEPSESSADAKDEIGRVDPVVINHTPDVWP